MAAELQVERAVVGKDDKTFHAEQTKGKVKCFHRKGSDIGQKQL